MNKIIIEPDKVEEYKSDAIENICKNIANEMDLKVFKEQQELTKMWEEKYYQIKKERDKQKEVLDKIKEYIDNYDVFKEFTFPLMKRDEEQQVLTSIKYEFDTSIKKNLYKILEEIE